MSARFSVLIPAYNSEKYIRQTIDSVFAQTFMGYEVIVADDGSTDRTSQILESYGTRIKVIRLSNRGAEAARNEAAARAHGEYLVMLDSDDLLLPRALAIYDRIIRTFDAPPLIVGGMLYFQDGQSIQAQAASSVEVLKFQDYPSKDVSIPLSNSRIVIRKSAFEEIGGYGNRGDQTFPPDDFNLVLKLGTRGPCIVVRNPYTVAYRQHQTNSLRNVEAVAAGILRLARFENEGRYPGGNERRWGRHAVIGGLATNWAFRRCWLQGHRKLAVRLLIGTAQMVAAAFWKKLSKPLREPTAVIALPEEEFQRISPVDLSNQEGRKNRSASADF